MASQKFNNDITIYGSARDIAAMADMLATLVLTGDEARDRMILAGAIELYNALKAEILYKGNIVWNKKKLVSNFKLMVKSGDITKMSKYTYKFLHLTCGSIAHYDQQGWIRCYRTIEGLRSFFRDNEYGQSVLDYQPMWKTDAIEIIKDINTILGVPAKAHKLNR